MSQERSSSGGEKRPNEAFGFTEYERLRWRVDQERFEEILKDESTLIHTIQESSNNYGDFLFITTSRGGDQGRICMTFYGLGLHEYRERWIYDEWFWYQANPTPDLLCEEIDKGEVEDQLKQRWDKIHPHISLDTQTERGRLFEFLADLTDEDGALAELEDLEVLGTPIEFSPEIVSPSGENLLDEESREMLPELYSGEEQGLDAVAQVKFFTPTSNWTWYASEFDGMTYSLDWWRDSK